MEIKKINPSKKFLEYQKEYKKKRLNYITSSPLFNDLKQYGREQGVEWDTSNGKSIFKHL